MNHDYDEPMFINVATCRDACSKEQTEAEIKEIIFNQPFAVLATQGEGQPYTSLISYAASTDLQHLVFATPVQTRKYSQIIKNKRVSLLIDNRSQQPESINLIRAITVTGQARPLENEEEVEQWARLLLNKHSYLAKFVNSNTSGLILIKVVRYFYVRRFQEVYQWIPQSHS
ncbi:MAG: pyridoxamine 5'-phosphate oxidase family protein [Bacillota bacterium]|nr:pyridoxamine 5'-phosphate oxidase family protein [Bacillota bacterium]MDW7729953.1 pyridoxamine 5'-phosphate oxidase family protein [Bacillota bacterium]